MSEENKDEIIVENAEAEATPNRKPLYIALAVIGVLVIGALGFWFLRNRDTGQIVQAPRTVSFGDNTSEQPTGEQPNDDRGMTND
jgi:hypothetical protein